MPFRPDADTWSKLKQMGSSFRFIHSTDGVICEIVDAENGKPYATSPLDKHGRKPQTEKDALTAAVKAARVSDKPMTTAQIVADHKRLRKENQEMKARLGDSEDSFEDDAFEGMKSKQLSEELKKRGLEEPPGKRNTKRWKNAAIDTLRQAA